MVWYDTHEIVECEKSDVLKEKAAPNLFFRFRNWSRWRDGMVKIIDI